MGPEDRRPIGFPLFPTHPVGTPQVYFFATGGWMYSKSAGWGVAENLVYMMSVPVQVPLALYLAMSRCQILAALGYPSLSPIDKC